MNLIIKRAVLLLLSFLVFNQYVFATGAPMDPIVKANYAKIFEQNKIDALKRAADQAELASKPQKYKPGEEIKEKLLEQRVKNGFRFSPRGIARFLLPTSVGQVKNMLIVPATLATLSLLLPFSFAGVEVIPASADLVEHVEFERQGGDYIGPSGGMVYQSNILPWKAQAYYIGHRKVPKETDSTEERLEKAKIPVEMLFGTNYQPVIIDQNQIKNGTLGKFVEVENPDNFFYVLAVHVEETNKYRTYAIYPNAELSDLKTAKKDYLGTYTVGPKTERLFNNSWSISFAGFRNIFLVVAAFNYVRAKIDED